MRHDLKVWPIFFEPLRTFKKRFEIRKGRTFEVGDELLLKEWAPDSTAESRNRTFGTIGVYTGREILADVLYVLRGTDPFIRAMMPEITEDTSILSIRVWMLGQDLEHMVRRNRQ